MNNEPVAWMHKNGYVIDVKTKQYYEGTRTFYDFDIPLYTHPAKDREADTLQSLREVIIQQQAEIAHLKELFGCDPAYYEVSKK